MQTQQAHQQAIHRVLQRHMDDQGGVIPFSTYMQVALYHPELGYYTRHCRSIGARGDFSTAPECSMAYNRCLANYCARGLCAIGGGSILEFGAGNGTLAATILEALAAESFFDHYYILELSAPLRARQQALIQTHYPELADKISWLKELPTQFSGVVLANEVLDAIPVERFYLQSNQLVGLGVGMDQGKLLYKTYPLPHQHKVAINLIRKTYLQDVTCYASEYSALIPAWLKSLSDGISKAMLVIIDYGYGASEYYHSQRTGGTLMCYCQHRAHPDPFYQPGQQDISAFVNFSAVADAATALGWSVEAYTNQAYFLLAQGISDQLSQSLDDFAARQAIKQLLLPHEMGELFKVLTLSKNCDLDLDDAQWPSLMNRL